jgi:hypothetical protein
MPATTLQSRQGALWVQGLTTRQFDRIHLQIQSAVGHTERNLVAILHQRKWATLDGLGADV